MGLFNRLSGLLQRLGRDPADDGIAEHTVTLAQGAQQQQQFLGMRAELLDYVMRACIDVLSQEQRAELTETVGVTGRRCCATSTASMRGSTSAFAATGMLAWWRRAPAA